MSANPASRIGSRQEAASAPLSRRRFLQWAGPGIAAALLAGCRTFIPDKDTPVETAPSPAGPAAQVTPPTPPATPTAAPTLTAPGNPTATPTTQATLTAIPSPTAQVTPAEASLEVQIGQMLMVGFRGLEVDREHWVVRDIQERHLGAVVLFDYDMPSDQPVRNVASPAQVQSLVASLQSFSSTPLLVAVDQEGGLVARLKERHGFPPTVSHRYLGTIDDLATTYEQAARIAQTLAGLGISMNLAPVVDLCTNPDNPVIARLERCFSADPRAVTRHALEFIRAHHAHGVLCTLKHFPGHGSSAADSHLGLVDVTATWSQEELEPYADIVEAGQADAIMTAHVFNSNLDAGYPATLSPATVTDLLRQELGYDGVILSDDLQMGAIVQHYGFEVTVQRAIEAGVDILAFANNSTYEEDIVVRAVTLIRRLVEEGTISRERIGESFRRIQRLKSRVRSALPVP